MFLDDNSKNDNDCNSCGNYYCISISQHVGHAIDVILVTSNGLSNSPAINDPMSPEAQLLQTLQCQFARMIWPSTPTKLSGRPQLVSNVLQMDLSQDKC